MPHGFFCFRRLCWIQGKHRGKLVKVLYALSV